MTEAELPPLPLFDKRRTRWAIARGVLRTAFLAFMLFVLLSLLAQLLGSTLLSALGRDDAMNRVGATGYQVGHPGLELQQQYLKTGPFSVKWDLGATTHEGLSITVPLSINAFGTLARPRRQIDPLDRVLMGGGASRGEAQAFLDRLPRGVRVDVVVQLAKPVRTDQIPAVGEVPGPFQTVFYSPLFTRWGVDDRPTVRQLLARPVSWSMRYWFDEGLDHSFRRWTSALRPSDDDNLETLGLPASAELKELARKDLVYGMYVRDQDPAVLARLLKDPRVKSFTPSAVRFALPAQASIS